MFVNKVLLGQSHSHLYTCCLVTETGHPTKPKIFTTQPLTGKVGSHPVWITLYCFKLWRCFCLPEPLSPRSLEPAGGSCPELPCKNASAKQVVRTCWLVSCPARLWTRAQSFLSLPSSLFWCSGISPAPWSRGRWGPPWQPAALSWWNLPRTRPSPPWPWQRWASMHWAQKKMLPGTGGSTVEASFFASPVWWCCALIH